MLSDNIAMKPPSSDIINSQPYSALSKRIPKSQGRRVRAATSAIQDFWCGPPAELGWRVESSQHSASPESRLSRRDSYLNSSKTVSRQYRRVASGLVWPLYWSHSLRAAQYRQNGSDVEHVHVLPHNPGSLLHYTGYTRAICGYQGATNSDCLWLSTHHPSARPCSG